MAYQAKRNKRFEEDFELVDENGVVQHTLKVSLDVLEITYVVGDSTRKARIEVEVI